MLKNPQKAHPNPPPNSISSSCQDLLKTKLLKNTHISDSFQLEPDITGINATETHGR